MFIICFSSFDGLSFNFFFGEFVFNKVYSLKESEASLDSDSTLDEITEESAIINTGTRHFYSLNEQVELGQMTSLYFNKLGRMIFYISLCIYLYGDLSIYVTAISDSFVDIICQGNGSVAENFSLPCWKEHAVEKMYIYRCIIVGFILTVGPFTYFNVQKTKYLQILTSVLRWSAFLIMIILALIHMTRHEGASPRPIVFSGVPSLIGASVYSFMCHHSLPGIIKPFTEKRFIVRQMGFDYSVICVFYILLAMTGSFAFKNLKDLYTLNFIPSNPEENNIFMDVIYYFLGAFPIFTLSTSFPIIAITLQNNLKALFLDVNAIERYNFVLRRLLFPTLAIIPPAVVAFSTHDLGNLVKYTGAYGGAVIQYIVPATLVWAARRRCLRDFGSGAKNKYGSPFRSNFWILLVLVWAVACTIVVTISINVKNE